MSSEPKQQEIESRTKAPTKITLMLVCWLQVANWEFRWVHFALTVSGIRCDSSLGWLINEFVSKSSRWTVELWHHSWVLCCSICSVVCCTSLMWAIRAGKCQGSEKQSFSRFQVVIESIFLILRTSSSSSRSSGDRIVSLILVKSSSSTETLFATNCEAFAPFLEFSHPRKAACLRHRVEIAI